MSAPQRQPGAWTEAPPRPVRASAPPTGPTREKDLSDPDTHKGCMFGRCAPNVVTLECRCFTVAGIPVTVKSRVRVAYRAYHAVPWDGSTETVRLFKAYGAAIDEMKHWLRDPPPPPPPAPVQRPEPEPEPEQLDLF